MNPIRATCHEFESPEQGQVIARVHVVVDWNERRWTVDAEMIGVLDLDPGFLDKVSVVSCVDTDGIGLETRLWQKLLEGTGAIAFKLNIEDTLRRGLQDLVDGPITKTAGLDAVNP